MAFTEREQVVEIINRLFYYTDYQLWDKLINEVFAKEVIFDITSLGATKIEILNSKKICDIWKEGFKDLDVVHHQTGNYIIDLKNNTANVKAYSIASHYKKDAKNGNTREFVGNYDLKLIKIQHSWKLNEFKYNLKYMSGNLDLK